MKDLLRFWSPSCRVGFTREDLRLVLGEDQLPAFDSWAEGVDLPVCDGLRFDRTRGEYEESGCGPHGEVVSGRLLGRFMLDQAP